MHDLSIHKIQQLYETKKASPIEVTEYCLHQIEQFHNLHAFITVTAEEALLQAKLTEQKMMTNNPLGKLEGIPIGWKDNIHTANIKTTSGSIVDEQFIPMKNASIVDHLLGQGAITLGKQNMHEFAFGITSNNPFYGPVKNPWDTSITAAGSSGGCSNGHGSGIDRHGHWWIYSDSSCRLWSGWIETDIWITKRGRCNEHILDFRSCRTNYKRCNRRGAYARCSYAN